MDIEKINEKPIFIDFSWMSSVLCSSIECYDNECFGLLGGENKKNGLKLFASIPLLFAESGPDYVNYNNQPEKYELAKEMIHALGLHVVGCYHSQPDAPPTPSDEDIISCIIEQINNESNEISTFDWWLEMIVGFSKKDYKYSYSPVFSFETDDHSLTGKIKQGHNGWDIHIKGH
jgi:proteasome lid subunit RPN8/RPN11